MTSTLFNNDPALTQNGGIALNNKIPNVKPLFKYIGGKVSIRNLLISRLPDFHIQSYCELFAGTLTLFRELQPPKAYLSDYSEDLMNIYRSVKHDPNELIEYTLTTLKEHRYDKEYFYQLRDKDRTEEFKSWTSKEKMLRYFHILCMAFCGRIRFNKYGHNTSNMGGLEQHVDSIEEKARRLRSWHEVLNKSETHIFHGDFEEVAKNVPIKDTFFYLDPPYHQGEKTRLEYTPEPFDEAEQIRLKNLCDKITRGGGYFMLSNSATDFILNLYKEYNQELIGVQRSAMSTNVTVRIASEVLITNYEKEIKI